MHSNLLSHAINREFPELADKVAKLKTSNSHFARLLVEHDDLAGDDLPDRRAAGEDDVAPRDARLHRAAEHDVRRPPEQGRHGGPQQQADDEREEST